MIASQNHMPMPGRFRDRLPRVCCLRWTRAGCINRRRYLPRKPLARKKIPADIRSLCRSYTAESVRPLAAIARQPEFSPSARVQAIAILLDRGWGKPRQAPAGEERDIRVTIRKIGDGGDEG